MSFSDHSSARRTWAQAPSTTSDEVEDLTGRISRSIYKLGSDINLIKKLVAKLGKAEGAAADELEAELYVCAMKPWCS